MPLGDLRRPVQPWRTTKVPLNYDGADGNQTVVLQAKYIGDQTTHTAQSEADGSNLALLTLIGGNGGTALTKTFGANTGLDYSSIATVDELVIKVNRLASTLGFLVRRKDVPQDFDFDAANMVNDMTAAGIAGTAAARNIAHDQWTDCMIIGSAAKAAKRLCNCDYGMIDPLEAGIVTEWGGLIEIGDIKGDGETFNTTTLECRIEDDAGNLLLKKAASSSEYDFSAFFSIAAPFQVRGPVVIEAQTVAETIGNIVVTWRPVNV